MSVCHQTAAVAAMVRVQAMRRRELRRFTRFGGAARDVMLRAPLSTVRWSVNTRTRLQQAGDISHFFRYLVDWMPLPIWVGSKQLKRALGSLEESSGESPLSTPVWFAPAVAMLRDSTISLALSPHLCYSTRPINIPISTVTDETVKSHVV